MKKISGFLVFLMAFGLVVGFMGCNDPAGSGVDFTDYTSNFSIRVQNNTKIPLVAFRTSPSSSTLIGGIPPESGVHGLPRPDGVFTGTSDFTLFIVTEEQYVNNKNNLSALSNAPFATLLAVYNANTVNNSVYHISQYLGGDFNVRIDNNTPFNVELRIDDPNGPPLGYARAGAVNVNLPMGTGDYTIFPVFRAIDSSKGEIISIHPRIPEGQTGAGNIRRRNIILDNQNPTALFEATQYYGSGVVFKTGSAYLTIINNNTSSAIELRRGALNVLTSTGRRFIPESGNMTFQLDMPRVGQSDQFHDTLPVPAGGLSIWAGGHWVNLPAFTFESEKVYRIEIIGDTEFDLRFPDGIVETGSIDIEAIFSSN